MRMRWIGRGFELALVILIVVAAGGQAVTQLWNWLMPALFKLPSVTFWQGFGLLMLGRLLFGGWGGGGYRMWGRMSPEQRERFRHGMRARCVTAAPAAGAKES